MADAARLGVDSVFLVGAGADKAIDRPTRSGDLLLLPCPNDYATLPQRTRWFCRWALNRGRIAARQRLPDRALSAPGDLPGADWDYLFKCDSDTYVCLPRLLAYCESLVPSAAHCRLPAAHYIGAQWRPGVAYGSGGGGYLLSREAAAIVAQKLTHTTGAEDLLVGQVLRQNGIRLTVEPRFVPFGSMERRPKPDNDLITTHKVGPDVFWHCHKEL